MNLISKQAELVNSPEFLQMILDHLANGGTVVEFCEIHELSYPACLKWLRQDVQRRDLFERALKDRDEWFIDKVMRELRDLSTYDLSDLYDPKGIARPMSELPSGLKRAIVGIKQTKDGKEIKFVDKVRTLELLGKAAGMATKVVVSGKLTLEQLIAQSMEPEKPNE